MWTAVVNGAPTRALLLLDPGQTTLAALLAVFGGIGLSIIALAGVAGCRRLHRHRQATRRARLERSWSPLLLDVLAGLQPRRALLERVERRDRLFFVDFLFRFAGRLRDDQRPTLSELARYYLPEIADRTRGGDAERRARAVETLALLDFQAYEAEILAGLQDPSPRVAMVAARSVCREKRVQHLDAVLTAIGRLDHCSAQELSSLLASSGPEGAPALRRVLADPARPTLARAVAAGALQALAAASRQTPTGVEEVVSALPCGE